MSDTKTTGLSALAANPADTDKFMIVDVSDTTMAPSGTNKYLDASYVSFRTNAETLTNKTLTAPVIGDFTSANHGHTNTAGGGQLDHGAALTGLSDDDHTIYLKADGTRAVTGPMTFSAGMIAAKFYPASDSTNAIGFYRADGTTQDIYYDSTNGRLGIGTVPASKLDVALTSAGASGGSVNGVLITNTISPSGASTQEVRSLNLSATLDTANGFSGSGLLIGVRGEARIVNAGAVGMSTAGVYGVGLIAGSNAASLTSATEVNGAYFVPISSFSNSLTATITRAYGVHVVNGTNSGSGPLTITAQVGLGVDSLTRGTNNIYILLGTGTAPGGSYAIYSTTTAISYFNGNVGVGTTSAAARVHVAGSMSGSAWGTAGVQFQAAAATITDSSTAVSGTATNAVANSFGRPTFAATNATVTMTNAATVYIANAPAAGTNVTLTNAYALWVDDGAARFDGNVGFFAKAPAAQQTSGADLTNNVTSGGTNDTITNWTDLTTYATDAAAIRNATYQLARKVKQINDALRLYGLLT